MLVAGHISKGGRHEQRRVVPSKSQIARVTRRGAFEITEAPIYEGKICCPGEMAEWLKAVASKAIVRFADRGFESLSLRHSTRPSLRFGACSWQAPILRGAENGVLSKW